MGPQAESLLHETGKERIKIRNAYGLLGEVPYCISGLETSNFPFCFHNYCPRLSEIFLKSKCSLL